MKSSIVPHRDVPDQDTRRVLVADDDRARARLIAAALSERGYSADEMAADSVPDVIVASSRSATALVRTLACPMLVIVDPADESAGFRLRHEGSDDAPDIDFLTAPVDSGVIVSHVEALLARRLVRLARRDREDRLRSGLRSALSVVRGGDSPDEIATLLLELVPPVFGARRAAFLTLPDERVPPLSHSVGGPSPLSGTPAEATLLRQLAETLWEEHSVVDLAARPAPGLRAAILPQRGLLVPVGAVDAGFGLLWLDREAERSWSRGELEAAQQAAREVGHLLAITHLAASRRALQRRLRAVEQAHATKLLELENDLRDPLTALLGRLDALHGPAAPASTPAPAPPLPREALAARSRWAEQTSRFEGTGTPSKNATEVAAVDSLTAREREMVSLVGLGLTNQDIAGRLHLSPLTVKTHVNRSMTKLGLADRAQLVVFAYRSGLAAAG